MLSPLTRRALPLLALAAIPACVPRDRIVVTNARVVDLANGAVADPAHLVVEGSRIVRVVRGSPPRGRRVDAAGGYVLPGLWDMHVHLTPLSDADVELLPTYGVTGVREMGSTPAVVDSLRARISRGELPGPTILRSGLVLDGQKEFTDRYILATPEEGRAAVAELAAMGVDHLKVHNGLPREVFFAVAAEARARGLPLVGHVPMEVSPDEALAAGMRTVEHVATIYEGTLSRNVRTLSDQVALVTTYPTHGADTLARHFVRTGAWFTPTLVAYASRSREPELAVRPDPRREAVSPGLVAHWDSAFPRQASDLDPRLAAIRKRGDTAFAALVTTFHRAGVPLLAGTDLGTREVYPGSSLIDELVLLVERSGLTPLEALRTATLNVADYLGARDTLGAVAPGMRADLVILGANPLEDIRSLRQVRGVIAGGRPLRLPPPE